MKTIISLTIGLLVALGAVETASASQVYYSYNGGYQNSYQNTYQGTYQNSYQNTHQASYSYTQGCYTYYYNGYTRSTSVTSYNCSNTNTQYSYVAPVISSYYTSPYYTYQYSHGSWSPSYNNNYNNTNNGYYYVTSPTVSVGYTDTNYNNGYGYGNYYDNGMSPVPSNPCYYVNGYYACQ